MLFFGKLSVFVTLNAVFVLSQNSKHWLGQISTIIPPWWDHNFCWNICALDYFWNIFRGVIIAFKKKNPTKTNTNQPKQPPNSFSSISYIYGKRLILFDSIYLPHYCIIWDPTPNILLFCTDQSSKILVKMFKNTSGSGLNICRI